LSTGDRFIHESFSHKYLFQATLIQNADSSLITCKGELDIVTEKYTKAKAEYEAAEQQVKEQGDKLDLLLDNREKAYREFIVSAITASAPVGSPSKLVFTPSPATATVPSTVGTISALKFLSPSSLSSSSSIMSASPAGKLDKESFVPEILPEGVGGVEVTGEPLSSPTATDAVRAAAAGATAATERASSAVVTAGGWLAKKLAVGVSQLQQITKPASKSDKEEALDTPTPGASQDTEQPDIPVVAATKPAWPSIDESPVTYPHEIADISVDGLQGETTEPTFVSKLSPVNSSNSTVVISSGKFAGQDSVIMQIDHKENEKITNVVKVEQGHNNTKDEEGKEQEVEVADLL